MDFSKNRIATALAPFPDDSHMRILAPCNLYCPISDYATTTPFKGSWHYLRLLFLATIRASLSDERANSL